jgi:hypothetical protein
MGQWKEGKQMTSFGILEWGLMGMLMENRETEGEITQDGRLALLI